MDNPILVSNSHRTLMTVVDLHFNGRGIVNDFTVPANYRWNGADIPQMFDKVIGGRLDVQFRIPSLAHDYLYEHPKICSRKAADRYFRLLLKEEGVGFMKRNTMYLAVRLAAWPFYNNKINN